MKPSSPKPAYFFPAVLFFFSGFCGLLYQLVWLRLAFASFGVNTPVLSVVLSVFMAGLGLGSICAGAWTTRWAKASARRPLVCYAAAEALIAVGAFAVPKFFSWGEVFLLSRGNADSAQYLLLSAIVLFISLLPWCFCMGVTYPLMMSYIQKTFPSTNSFSFLYNANVLGAMSGVLVTALVLIERLGFRGALSVAASLNAAISFAALGMAFWVSPSQRSIPEKARGSQTASPSKKTTPYLMILFLTGFICMAMEVIWTRGFTLVLRTEVYSFASLLFFYLLATFLGSWLYRTYPDLRSLSAPKLIGLAFASSLFVVLIDDPHIHQSYWGVLFSIVPFCLSLGYLTPKLVDQFSSGNPEKAARAYAVNVLGCILGPLAASYLLLPALGVKWSLVLLSLFLVPFFLKDTLAFLGRYPRSQTVPLGSLALLLLGFSLWASMDYERVIAWGNPHHVLYRDYAATVTSGGVGRERRLYVNGIAMTGLHQATKDMAHLPLLFLPHKPESALVICFGMGTSFRSLLSWNIKTTAAELVPSVFRSFDYFHADADSLRKSPNARMVVDDGRRFLKRSSENFDVITIDPPPPLEAAASSLLYSREFFGIVKEHLKEGGVLQLWIPFGDPKTWRAIVKSLRTGFPYVRVFPNVERIGCYFIASNSPIKAGNAKEMMSKMPASALSDWEEWMAPGQAGPYLSSILAHEAPVGIFDTPEKAPMITDDRPFNEYFLMRRVFQ